MPETDTPAAVPVRLVGRDRAITRELLVVLVVVMVAVVLAAMIAGLGDLVVGVGGAAVLALLAASALTGLDVLSSALELHPDELRLRYALGLRTRVVALPARVEIGRLRARRPTAGMHAQDLGHEDVDAGVYLRLIGDRSRITISSRKGTAFRKRWDPSCWRAGAPARASDIDVDRETMIVLESALAAAGVLVARAR
jgi:hypothetical protein